MKINCDPYDYTYTSRRNLTYGLNGMVASSQQQASQAGLEMFRIGGNAIDAAIATAITLTVVEPTSNGVGGDAFALVWTSDGLKGLNASGYAGSKADAEKLRARGFDKMPDHGMQPVTVPGIPSAWKELSEKYGRLPFARLFEPAVKLAEEGYAVSPVIAGMWQDAWKDYSENNSGKEEFQGWFDTFAPEGRAPAAGERFVNPQLAETLRELAETGCESFYRGKLAKKIVEYSDRFDGNLTLEDLADFRPEWVDPIHVNYRGYDVWEIPPNGHGIIALMALGILNGFELREKEAPETYHRSIEALKLAFSDGKRYVADRSRMSVTTEQLLAESYLAKRRALISDNAIMPEYGDPSSGGTVYLCTADGEGNMVSYIQSNYWGFGSGVVVPGTGIALHNRGREFSLDPGEDNYLMPGKKPYHTIIPGFLTKDGKPVGPFGVMGAYMQPQGHVQVVENMIDFHMNPQQALNAPRWQWTGDRKVLVEYSFPADTFRKLQEMGHEIKYSPDTGSFGRGQIIVRMDNGTLAGATEPRTDGAVLGC